MANPALGDFLYEDGMATEARTVRESAFRQFRLGQWPTGPEGAWMAPELWASRCRTRGDPGRRRRGARARWVVLAGLHRPRRVPTLRRRRRTSMWSGLWENPNPADETYRVDVLDVEDAIREACRRWHVVEVTADPFRWQRSLAVLADERIPVSEYPQRPSRMTPACSRVLRGRHRGDGHALRRQASRPARRERRAAHRLAGRPDREGVEALQAPHRPRRRRRHGALSRAVELARRPAPSIYVG